MTRDEALRACCAFDKSSWMGTPFDFASHIVGCNGYMLAAVPGSCGRSMPKRPHRDAKMRAFLSERLMPPDRDPDFTATLASLRDWAGTDYWQKCPCGAYDCEKCNGEHIIVCYACGEERPCPACTGRPNRCAACDGYGFSRRGVSGIIKGIGLNLSMLATALRVFEGEQGEQVKIWYEAPNKALTFRCGDAVIVLLPERVTDHFFQKARHWEDRA